MREPENIRAVEECTVDMMGFIFYPQSPRFVAKKPGYLPDKIRRIGVFVDETLENIRSRITEYGLCMEMNRHTFAKHCGRAE